MRRSEFLSRRAGKLVLAACIFPPAAEGSPSATTIMMTYISIRTHKKRGTIATTMINVSKRKKKVMKK